MLRILCTGIACLWGWMAMSAADSTAVHFKLAGKLIILELEIDGQTGNYILDSGTSGLLLNDKYFGGIPSSRTILGLANQPVRVLERVSNLQIGRMTWAALPAKVLPLDHLEKLKGQKLHGLIGTDIFRGRNLELTIDYRRSVITIYKANRKGTKRMTRKSKAPDVQADFIWSKGIPTITAQLGRLAVKIGLDTGAEANLANKANWKKIRPYFNIHLSRQVMGLDRNLKQLPTGTLHNLWIGNHECRPLLASLLDIPEFQYTDRHDYLDLLVGYDFLHPYFVAINFREKEIRLWANPAHPASGIAITEDQE